jgi:hypothetical protein
MSKQEHDRIRKRMSRYVARDTIERRLERYTIGYEILAQRRKAITKLHLAQSAARM